MTTTSTTDFNWDEGPRQLARTAISELKARYCRFLDCKQWPDFAGVFTPDGCMQFGPNLEDGSVNGREEITALLKKQLKNANTAHRIHPGEFKFHDNGEVSVLWPMDDRVANPSFVLEGAGYYQERYRQIDGQWYIQHMRLRRLRVDMIPNSIFRPSALGMRLVLLMQKTGLLKLLSPANSKTLAQATETGISEDLFQ